MKRKNADTNQNERLRCTKDEARGSSIRLRARQYEHLFTRILYGLSVLAVYLPPLLLSQRARAIHDSFPKDIQESKTDIQTDREREG